MMQTSGPVDSNICLARVKSFCCIYEISGSVNREHPETQGNTDVLIDPPAEIEQNSKSPSKAGLSSPTRTADAVTAVRIVTDVAQAAATHSAFHQRSSLAPSLVLLALGSQRIRLCGNASSGLQSLEQVATNSESPTISRGAMNSQLIRTYHNIHLL